MRRPKIACQEMSAQSGLDEENCDHVLIIFMTDNDDKVKGSQKEKERNPPISCEN